MKRQKKSDSAPLAAPEKTVLILRSCNAQLQSYGGFQWPESGPVSAPDWKPNVACGNGLHGFLWGEGDSSLADFGETSKWLVVSVVQSSIVDIGGKVKYPSGIVVFCGDRIAAGKYVVDNGGFGRRVISGTATAGDAGTATAGARGTATAGYAGTATAGDDGTATAGDAGTVAIHHWNGKRWKLKIATIKDEDGDGDLEPNAKYRLNNNGEFVKVE